MAIGWQLRHTLPQQHTHPFDKRAIAWGASAPSGAATLGIWPAVQSREVTISTFGCQFSGVCYHSHWSRHGVGRNLPNRGLATQQSIGDFQLLLRFTNFYQCFIRKYAKVTLPHTELHKKADMAGEPLKGKPQRQKLENLGKVKWEWAQRAELALWKLKRTFTEATILQHCDPAEPIILQMVANGFSNAGNLNQYHDFRALKPVNVYSRKCSSAGPNKITYDREQLAIVETLHQWRHYRKAENQMVLIGSDHKNIEYFQTSKVLSRRQARWSETVFAYDFVINHLEGRMCPADGPSRRPDYEIIYERPLAPLFVTVWVGPYNDLMPAIIVAQASNSLAVDILAKLVDATAADETDIGGKETHRKVLAGALSYEGRIYIPAVAQLRGKGISLFYDNPESGHFGALKTTELVSRDFYWPAMGSNILKYVTGCEVCHWIEVRWNARHGRNMPLETPSRPWEGVTMDFITYLP